VPAARLLPVVIFVNPGRFHGRVGLHARQANCGQLPLIPFPLSAAAGQNRTVAATTRRFDP
jgi:hypothetical protein